MVALLLATPLGWRPVVVHSWGTFGYGLVLEKKDQKEKSRASMWSTLGLDPFWVACSATHQIPIPVDVRSVLWYISEVKSHPASYYWRLTASVLDFSSPTETCCLGVHISLIPAKHELQIPYLWGERRANHTPLPPIEGS